MNELERHLRYPLGQVLPEAASKLEVAPGLFWLRLPLPFALDHVNLWLLRDEWDGRQGWTVVDCGIDNPALRAQWEQVIAHELEGLPIVRVLVTHMHPDHLGLAHWLCARFDADLWMTHGEYTLGRLLSHGEAGSGAGGHASATHFHRHGLVEAADLAKVKQRKTYYSNMVPAVPPTFRRLVGGQTIEIGGRSWQILIGMGHSPEHVSLYCAASRLLMAGDMVLPRISTNVSVFEMEPEADPLALYLHTLDSFSPLPAETLVLPSHGKPFQGLHVRIQQLHAHHQERLEETLALCRQQPSTARELVPVMFRRELDLHQLTFAMGEAIAHLNYLWLAGQLRREMGGDGLVRFAVTDIR